MKQHIKLYEEFTKEYPMQDGVYTTEEGIRAWMDEYCVIWGNRNSKYDIDSDTLEVVINGNCRFLGINGRLPINIRHIDGERCEIPGGNIGGVYTNNLTSLKGLPSSGLGGVTYYIQGHKNLTSVEGAPKIFRQLILDDCGITHIDKNTFVEGNGNSISLNNNNITDVSFLDGRFSSVFLKNNLIEDISMIPEEVTDFLYLNGNQIFTLLGAKRYFLLHTLAGNPCKKPYELAGYNEKTWNDPQVHAKAMTLMPKKCRPKVHEFLKQYAKDNWNEYKKMVGACPELQTMYPIENEALDVLSKVATIEKGYF